MPNRPPIHRNIGVLAHEQTRRSYDRQRGAAHSRAYGRRWQKLRLAYLAQHPLCECGCGYGATVVDHIVPHLGDPALIYDWGNLQALTKACHDRKTVLRDGGFGRAPSTRRDPIGGRKVLSANGVDRPPIIPRATQP